MYLKVSLNSDLVPQFGCFSRYLPAPCFWPHSEFTIKNSFVVGTMVQTLLSADGRPPHYLQWANVSLLADCQRFYGDRIKPGMTCAGRSGRDVLPQC